MRENFDVVVIGGGTTGTGVIRDLVLRGFPNSLLLERDDRCELCAYGEGQHKEYRRRVQLSGTYQ